MEKIIRIKAVSPFFEIEEEVKESKSIKRLQQIKKLFETARTTVIKDPWGRKKQTMIKPGQLKVTTTVVNPAMI